MDPRSLHEDDWDYVRTLLPTDLEDSARLTQALRRCRNVPDAAALIRMALAYALTDLSLKDVAAWASSLNLAEITGPGLFYRLRQAEGWLERILGQILAEQVPLETSGLPIRVVDATVINGPGGRVAVEWRAHVLISAVTGTIRSVQFTGDEGGEKLSRYVVQEGEVILGDRAYGTARGLHAVSQQGAKVVVRFNPASLRTCDLKRRRIHLEEREEKVPSVGAVEFPILISIPPPPTKSHKTWDSAKAIAWIPARAVAARTRSGEVIWILSTLPNAVPALAVMGQARSSSQRLPRPIARSSDPARKKTSRRSSSSIWPASLVTWKGSWTMAACSRPRVLSTAFQYARCMSIATRVMAAFCSRERLWSQRLSVFSSRPLPIQRGSPVSRLLTMVTNLWSSAWRRPSHFSSTPTCRRGTAGRVASQRAMACSSARRTVSQLRPCKAATCITGIDAASTASHCWRRRDWR